MPAKWISTLVLIGFFAIINGVLSVDSHDKGSVRSSLNEGLSMAEVRTAINRAMSGKDSRMPTPRDILSANVSGTTLKNPILDFTESFNVGKSCYDILVTQNASQSGLYLVHPPNIVQGPWKVYCDQESEGGGWTVFQVRDDVEPHENFMRNWEDYKLGFGDFDREFWLGNILLWALTNSNDNKKYELAVNLEDWSGNKRFARYKGFRIGPESDKYRLYFTKMFLGNAGDSLFSHNGLAFSTFDVDNDNREGEDFAERSCARLYKGGWWYGNCHDSNLNGWYLGGPHRSFADGINWYTWSGYNYSLRRTMMRFRPVSDNYTSNGPSIGLSVPNSYSPIKPDSYLPMRGFRNIEDSSAELKDQVEPEPGLNQSKSNV
ncbi:techylectin-5B-like [Daphnia pulex]|uniref:techylectin-5B-like n=1 Tax=Daphnia pulex TaxID=6669 RepID=UPI001EE091F5|nr:techylectin-5B-like [Daphnia pulex]